MINALHDLDFAADGFLSLNVFHLFLLVDFQSHFCIWLIAHTEVHKCISSLSDLLTYCVFIQIVIIGENNLFFLWRRCWFLLCCSRWLLRICFRFHFNRLVCHLLSNLSRLTIIWRLKFSKRNIFDRFRTDDIVLIALNLVHHFGSIPFITNISQGYVCSARR